MTLMIGNPEQVDTGPRDAELAGGATRPGERDVRVLLVGTEGRPDNYHLLYTQGVEGSTWTTPRHTHVFEQIRLVLEGDYSVARNESMPVGWVGYFPESAFYGPQTRPENLKMLTLQFGGPTGRGFLSRQQSRKARERLIEKGGRFEDGMYVWTDANNERHQQDSHEAIYAEHFGEPIVYSPPRYRDYILMDPERFSWKNDPSMPGVAHKRLGTFTERDIKISFIAMDKGASLMFGTEPSAEIVWVQHGAVSHDGKHYDTLTAFGSAAEDDPVTLVAEEQSTLYYLKLPTF